MEILMVLLVMCLIGAGGLIMFLKGAEWVLLSIRDIVRSIFKKN